MRRRSPGERERETERETDRERERERETETETETEAETTSLQSLRNEGGPPEAGGEAGDDSEKAKSGQEERPKHRKMTAPQNPQGLGFAPQQIWVVL